MAKEEKEAKSYAEELGIDPVSLPVAGLVCQLCWYDKQVPLLIGVSAIGKTAILKQMAEVNGYRYEHYALAHMESTDLTGPMYASKQDPSAFTFLRDGRLPFRGFDDENDKVLVNCDEANRADMTVLNAAFPLWTERRVGPHTLGKNVVVAASMNPPDGDYAVTSQFSHDPAMRRRVCQVYVNFNVAAFLSYASNPKRARMLAQEFTPLDFPSEEEWKAERQDRPYHDAVLTYIRANPDMALDEKARDAGKVYACPATWEAASDTLYTVERLGLDLEAPVITQVVHAKLAGNLGAMCARKVMEVYQQVTELLVPREVLLDFKEGTPIYKRVMRALNRGDNAVIAQLLDGIALELHGPEEGDLPFALEEVTPQLGLLYKMLPPQQTRALDSKRIAVEKERSGGLQDRAVAIQRLLSRDENFKEAFMRTSEAYEKSRDEMLKAEQEFAQKNALTEAS